MVAEPYKYPSTKFNLTLLCGYKLFQQIRLSTDSDAPINLLETNVQGDLFPTNKKFQVYNKYNIHKNARAFFLQWLVGMKEVGVRYNKEIILNISDEILNHVPEELAKELYSYQTYELSYIIEHSAFRTTSAMLLDKNDWKIVYERIGNRYLTYAVADQVWNDQKIHKVHGREEVTAELWPMENLEPPKKEVENHFVDDYRIPKNADKDINWINKIPSDYDK